MPKFRVYFAVNDLYCVDIEADSVEGMMDKIYENPPIDQRDSFVSSTVDIEEWEEIDG